ncbi:MAG: NTP transferase domain-containing protein [Lutibacter sp.]|uniref:nucleotidyltransferase family protein n=1 Tax=Lutibacter sp. TaxID=1925666 RepID=UPI0019F63889|nr:NTP transferase domain-containing protein [Lutibacter sp.]NOR28244.1 NTP transferase domain-containing protein [Lutibacter sp.]
MESNTVFVLLAGGKSERMGVDKGLLKYQHTFWVLEQLSRISKTTISAVYIGLGFNFENYFKAIPWLEDAVTNFVNFQGLHIKVVINKNPELGSFSTLQTVLKNINTSNDVLLNHIDVPILNSKELQKIIETKNTVVIPNYEGKNGHPIKMDFTFWKQLFALKIADKNARLDFQIKKINPTKISKIEVSDRNILRNINTKKDWISFLNKIN